ncbi:hypothetical protein C8Q75DRAFT_158314 [Abortiporus biennis]|nr:hypothetical protein C8Q75DRAFT_158314 [Abortiporus biennis]
MLPPGRMFSLCRSSVVHFCCIGSHVIHQDHKEEYSTSSRGLSHHWQGLLGWSAVRGLVILCLLFSICVLRYSPKPSVTSIFNVHTLVDISSMSTLCSASNVPWLFQRHVLKAVIRALSVHPFNVYILVNVFSFILLQGRL